MYVSVDMYMKSKSRVKSIFVNSNYSKSVDNTADSRFVRKLERVFALQTKHLTFVTPYPLSLGQRLALLDLKYRQCDITCTRDRSPKIEGDTLNWSALG